MSEFHRDFNNAERYREYTISILQSQLDASRMKWLKDNARREAAAEQLNPANGE